MTDILGYEGIYKIYSDGNIFSIKRKTRYNKIVGGIFLKQGFNKNTGYMQVCLKKDGKTKTFQVHTLVATYFLKKINGKNIEVNHKDGNKKNNDVSNLEWIEHKDNIKHQYTNLNRVMSEEHKQKLINSIKNKKKTNLYCIKKSLQQSKALLYKDKIIELRKKGMTQKYIANIFSISQSSVARFLGGKLKCQTLK